jgi:sporulation protein YlmC with PRC-barrel domain
MSMLQSQRTLFLSLTLLLALVLSACNVGNQQPVVVGEATPVVQATTAVGQPAAPPSEPQVTTPGTTGATFGLAGAEQGYMMLASTLLGREVVSTANENLGTVEDFLVDMTDGNIPFALISHGGFLGIAQDQAPIPLSAMSVNTGQTALILNVTQDQLQNFPNVDVSNDWPAGLNAGWDTELRNFWTNAGYNVDTIDATQTGSVVRASQMVNAGFGLGAGTGVAGTGTAGTGTGAAAGTAVGVNSVSDYIVDLSQGRVMYAVVNYADAGVATTGETGVTTAGETGLGTGEQWLIVPFQAISMDMQTGVAGELNFGQNLNADILTNAPRIQGDNLNNADFFAPGWDEQIRSYWGEQGYNIQ